MAVLVRCRRRQLLPGAGERLFIIANGAAGIAGLCKGRRNTAGAHKRAKQDDLQHGTFCATANAAPISPSIAGGIVPQARDESNRGKAVRVRGSEAFEPTGSRDQALPDSFPHRNQGDRHAGDPGKHRAVFLDAEQQGQNARHQREHLRHSALPEQRHQKRQEQD